MIPLTLRAMHRTPHPHGPSLGRPAVALVSVLALLAFACFPVLAQAETVYETESTTLPGGGGGKSPTQKNPVSHESSPNAHSSGAPGNSGPESTPGSSQSQNRASDGNNPSTPGGGGQAQSKQGDGANHGNKQAGGDVQSAKPLSTTLAADDNSSSPLVPILIAVVVLAAISVGVVLARQRRGSGGLFSPKAS
jgi:cobalamin biosynthesis Mg chelatase CobN